MYRASLSYGRIVAVAAKLKYPRGNNSKVLYTTHWKKYWLKFCKMVPAFQYNIKVDVMGNSCKKGT
jgi:hypothetical protein